MRTTIRLNEEVLRSAKQHALSTKRTFTQLVQDAIVLLIEKEQGASSPRTVALPTFKGDGVHPGIDINNSRSLIDQMEISQPE